VKVRPNAAENAILAQEGTSWTVAIAAPPDGNKANLELIKFLSKKMKKRVKIRSGFRNRVKILEILG
jgi:uncharacterized protein (TIGR00251 family)